MTSTYEPIEVKAEDVGLRIDRFIERRFEGLNFINIQKLLRTGQIRLDGKRVSGSKRLELGNKIRIPSKYRNIHKNKFKTFKPLDNFWKDLIDHNILYRDEEILAINKPSGVAVQGGSKIKNHLDDKLDFFRFDSLYRPQLLHRLDKDTSGVIVLSRNPITTKRLGDEFKNRNIKKVYLAIIIGHMPKRKGSINNPLTTVKKDNYEITSKSSVGKEALTFYTVLWKGYYKNTKISLVEFNPETGRKHQIRAHCKELGCSILGDKKYRISSDTINSLNKLTSNFHLHAREIGIPDVEGLTIRITAPIPIHMKEVLNMLNISNSIIEY